MKKYLASLFVILGMTGSYAQENDTPEYSGESFSLEGALAMLKKASTIEEFEELINNEKNEINNLDLNNDGNTDYVTVEDVTDNNQHVLVLSALVGENDKQDVATIVIEKTGKEEARLQIFGDEDLYEENTIAEPFDLTEKLTGKEKGPSIPELTAVRVIVNVWFWPSVRFIYAPGYRVWVSPVRWKVYPRWWRPWRPIRHNIFVTRCHIHKTYIHRTPTRSVVVHKSYAPRRHRSATIVKSRKGTTVIHKGRAGKVRAVHTRRR
ncbi:hypothetical protein [Flavobacterium sp. H122]|uniref:hypothetical protein n=1 Tax=Flavobacterium sp. H122 TaxID=2529860 RepID=UPI0010A9A5CE|nr:hypothetical protein [Flavobacterium sp. H122]